MSKLKFELDKNKYEAFYDGESCDLYRNDELLSSGLLSDVMDNLVDEGFPKTKIDQIYKSLKVV